MKILPESVRLEWACLGFPLAGSISSHIVRYLEKRICEGIFPQSFPAPGVRHHRSSPLASGGVIHGLNVKAVQGESRFPWNGLTHLRTLGVARPWVPLSLSLRRAPHAEDRGRGSPCREQERILILRALQEGPSLRRLPGSWDLVLPLGGADMSRSFWELYGV